MLWSFKFTVVELTVVVVPLTVRFPAIVTLFGRPIVTVPADSATSTSLVVPANVIVPPSDMAVLSEPTATVIAEFASFALAILPASWAFVIVPLKLEVG